MITFKLNGKSIQIPSQWEDVTVEQYLKILDLKDDYIQLVSIFTGIDYEVLRNAKINGLEKVLVALSFMDTIPDFTAVPEKLMGYTLPKDITFESLGQFEDVRTLSKQLPNKEITDYTIDDIKLLTDLQVKACCIYVQKLRDKVYDHRKAMAMVDEMVKEKAADVIPVGSFFLIKPRLLLLNTKTSSHHTSKNRKN